MSLYIGIIIILSIFSVGVGTIKNVKKTTVLKISFLVLWVLATFRGIGIGNDTISYYDLFKRISITQNFQYMTWRYEIGYLWLNKVISAVTSDFTVFLGIINTFIYCVYYQFIKRYSSNYIMSVFLFFTLGIWGNTVNIIRLELAISVAIIGFMIKDCKNTKKFLGLGISIISVLFQRISVVYILGQVVPKKMSKRFYVYSGVIALISIIILPKLMDLVGKVIPYFSEFYLSAGSSYSLGEIKIAAVINMLMAFVVFLFGFLGYSKRISCTDEDSDMALQINMVYLSFLILLVSLRFNLLDRCSYFFWTFSIVMIPNAFEYIKSKSNRRSYKFMIIAFCILYFVITNVYRPEWNSIYPYEFIFSVW
jgi:hypothetical protein